MKKLFSKRGFTLAEMLIAVMLLGFVSLMATVMTSAVLHNTLTIKEVSQAEVLGSEALENVQGQLRFAQNITIDKDGGILFDIDNANKGYTLAVKEGRIILGQEKDGVIEGDMLFGGSSYGNLDVSDLKFAQNDGAVVISVAIDYKEETIWNGSISVKPLNGIISI